MTSTSAPGGADRPRRPAVVLVGFMGAGKTTVGRRVADRLGVDFLDTDHEIERREERTIPEIFAAGEDAFRTLEAETIADVVGSHDGVVSLGGGAVTTPAVRDTLDGQLTVYLRISATDGYARVAGSDRPLLAVEDPETRYGELLAEREDIYRAVANLEVDAAADPDDIADAIILEIARDLEVGTPTSMED